MKKTNKTAVMVAIVCTVLVLGFSAAAVMMATGAKDDESRLGGGNLPEKYAGSWELPADSHVIQSPRNTDMTEDDALADEGEVGVMMTFGAFTTLRIGTVNNPTYQITYHCDPSEMDKCGMQSDGIMDEFEGGSSVTRVDVYDTSGEKLCDTVFIIDDQFMIYYGTGNFVFCAVKMDAVG